MANVIRPYTRVLGDCRGASLAPKEFNAVLEEFKPFVTVTLIGAIGAVVSITQLSVWIPVPILPDKS